MAKVDGFELPGELHYERKEHLWARIEEGKVRVGLDMLAQESAGPVKHIQLKPVGTPVAKKKMFGTIEAGKYVGGLRSPVNGVVTEINEKVLKEPGLVNNQPYGDGWFVVIQPDNLEEDLRDLVHGDEEVQTWLENEVNDYRRRGLLKR